MRHRIHEAPAGLVSRQRDVLYRPAVAASGTPAEHAAAPAAVPASKTSKPDWLAEALSGQCGRYDRR
jgi:hypothetical protein